jgi:hypothetical protein
MNLLAIETSTELGSIAIWRDGELAAASLARSAFRTRKRCCP